MIVIVIVTAAVTVTAFAACHSYQRPSLEPCPNFTPSSHTLPEQRPSCRSAYDRAQPRIHDEVVTMYTSSIHPSPRTHSCRALLPCTRSAFSSAPHAYTHTRIHVHIPIYMHKHKQNIHTRILTPPVAWTNAPIPWQADAHDARLHHGRHSGVRCLCGGILEGAARLPGAGALVGARRVGRGGCGSDCIGASPCVHRGLIRHTDAAIDAATALRGAGFGVRVLKSHSFSQ